MRPVRKGIAVWQQSGDHSGNRQQQERLTAMSFWRGGGMFTLCWQWQCFAEPYAQASCNDAGGHLE